MNRETNRSFSRNPPTGANAFNDERPSSNDPSGIETDLLRSLQIWQKDPNTILDDQRSVMLRISEQLEGYICECIHYGPDSLSQWWSDGVIHLEIENSSPNHFKLLGVTWIDSHGLAPFELDVDLQPDNDCSFGKTVFRIGMVDSRRQPILCDDRLATQRVLQMRPQRNRDWAMAVELTSPDTTQ